MDKGITVIIPAYNAEKYLDLSIGSVLDQTYKDFDLIIVDDGSNDGTLELCKKYALSDNRIKVFHKENGGVASARNYALDRIDKEYVMFMDADDYIDRDFIKKHIEVAERGYDCVVSGFYNVNRDVFLKDHNCIPDKVSIWKQEIDAPDFKTLSDKFILIDRVPSYLSVPWNKVYKTSFLNDHKLRFKNTFSEDHVFNYECMKYINSCYVLNWAGYYFIHGKDFHLSGTHKYLANYECIQAMMQQYDFLISRFNIKDKNYLKSIRWRYLNRIRSLAFKGYFPEAYITYKERIQVWNTIWHDDIVRKTKILSTWKDLHDKSMSIVLMLVHFRLYYWVDPFIRLFVKLRKNKS